MNKVIYINSRNQTIEERMVSDFKSIQELVGTGVLESVIHVGKKTHLLVDEMGFYHRDKNDNTFHFKGLQNPIIGDGVITSYDDNGDRDDVKITIDEVKEMVLF